MNARLSIWWLGLPLLLGLLILLRPSPTPRDSEPELPPPSPPPSESTRSLSSLFPRPMTAMFPEGSNAVSTGSSSTNWIERLLMSGEWNQEPPTLAQIQAWLTLNGTNAASLMALRQAGAGKDYLKEALRLYPEDPRVLASSLILEDLPESKRDRLERLKEVAPENALAYYESAREHFSSGNTEQAIADLQAASTKTQYDDYMVEAIQDCEELYQSMGKDPTEAKVLACMSALLPHLSQFKGLARDLSALQSEYIAAGDVDSAVALAQYGLQLSHDLTSGSGSKTMVGQLVGIATEKLVLQSFDSGTYYDFLGMTPAERLQQLETERATLKERANWVESVLPTMPPGDLESYFERFKLFGEKRALAWLMERYQDTP